MQRLLSTVLTAGMPIRYLPRLGALMLLPLVTGACGFIFMRGPPENNQELPDFNCTESNLGAILDVLQAGLGVVTAIAAATEDEGTFYSQNDLDTVAGVSAVWTVVFGLSAATGFTKNKKCRAAKMNLAERQQKSAATTEPWQIQFQFTRTLPDALATSVPRFPVRMTYDTTAVTATE